MSLEAVRGVDIDAETRCVHYDSDRDIVALRFGCCGMYYACYQCHSDLADHDAEAWPSSRRGEPAAMCGVCETALSASEYIGADACPVCDSSFNPDCADHYHIYFEWIDDAEGG